MTKHKVVVRRTGHGLAYGSRTSLQFVPDDALLILCAGPRPEYYLERVKHVKDVLVLPAYIDLRRDMERYHEAVNFIDNHEGRNVVVIDDDSTMTAKALYDYLVDTFPEYTPVGNMPTFRKHVILRGSDTPKKRK